MTSTTQQTYVRYSDDVKVKQANEDQQTRQVVESMARVNRMMFGKHRYGILRGEFQIYDHLPQPLAQDLFKTLATYPVIVRFFTAPGTILSDGQPTFRGMGIKVIGVEETKFLPEEADALTQDFLLVNKPVIPTGTVET